MLTNLPYKCALNIMEMDNSNNFEGLRMILSYFSNKSFLPTKITDSSF